jgi:Ca2+-binding RTX toxin-like protein
MIVLDFDGINASEVVFLAARVNTDLGSSGGLSSFVGGFATLNTLPGGYSTYQFLDFDRNGVLDGNDGEIAAERIMARVREDFAPYNVEVVRQDNTISAVELLLANPEDDALIHVDGNNDPAVIGGRAPGVNRRDDAGRAGGSVGMAIAVATDPGPATASQKAAAFVNWMANYISHEVGHTFGLAHIKRYEEPAALDTSFMTEDLGPVQNLTFADVTYDVAGAEPGERRQNEHQHLTRVLGAARKPWAAALTPGIVTIMGSEDADHVGISVVQGANGQPYWQVTIISVPQGVFHIYRVDPVPATYSYSLHPFPTPVHTFQVMLGGGHDYLWVDGIDSTGVTAAVKAAGGAGNDILYGGSNGDLLRGEAGNDMLFGQWSHDDLDGGDANDVLVGGDGNDHLWGRGGRDLLIGGNNSDRLFGGGGQDLLIAGSTTFDKNESALGALRAEWTSSRNYETRRANLQGLGSGPRANGSFFLIVGVGATVINDAFWDELTGGNDRDLYFADLSSTNDKILDLGGDERVTEL